MAVKLCLLLIAVSIFCYASAVPSRVVRQADSTTTTTPSPRYTACLNQCLTTQQYNPVCGTDGVTYSNQARLNCARRCGQNVQLAFRGTCQAL